MLRAEWFETLDCLVGGGYRLSIAAALGDFRTVEALLLVGTPSHCDISGCTPLHDACRHPCNDIAVHLLDGCVDVDRRNDDGDTALDIALGCGHRRWVWVLADAGATVPTTHHLPRSLQCGRSLAAAAVTAAASRIPGTRVLGELGLPPPAMHEVLAWL